MGYPRETIILMLPGGIHTKLYLIFSQCSLKFTGLLSSVICLMFSSILIVLFQLGFDKHFITSGEDMHVQH